MFCILDYNCFFFQPLTALDHFKMIFESVLKDFVNIVETKKFAAFSLAKKTIEACLLLEAV